MDEPERFTLTYSQCEVLAKLWFVKNHVRMTMQDLGKIISQDTKTTTHPYIYSVVKLLIKEGVIEKYKQFLKINHRKLKEFIWNQKKMQFWIKYFGRAHLLAR